MEDGTLDFEKPIRVLEEKIEDLQQVSSDSDIDLSDEIQRLKECLEQQKRITYSNLSAWERVQLAREQDRPGITEFIDLMLDEFVELHGDHTFQDDTAMVTGFARMAGERFMLLGHRRGSDTEERMECNFGSAHPEGYRKAREKMKLAEKFDLPIVSLINTPGAYPGIGAEERGQARAIAKNMFEMSRYETPIICIVTGEGGSGGAIGIGVGDYFSIMENAYYSVISPEGCGAILWKSGDKAPEAAEALKLTPEDLKEHNIVDEVIPEPLGGAHRDPKSAADILKSTILRYIDDLKSYDTDELLERRYQKHREIGAFVEESATDTAGPTSETSPSESVRTDTDPDPENTPESNTEEPQDTSSPSRDPSVQSSS